MGVNYALDDEIPSEQSWNEKALGLLRLEMLGLRVPEWLYIPHVEFIHYCQLGQLSSTCINSIESFIKETIMHGHLPFFSLRGESKSTPKYKPRPPLSLLNIGIEVGDATSWPLDQNFAHSLRESFLERISLICTLKGAFFAGESLVEHVCHCIKLFYDETNRKMKEVEGFNYGIILQRMVYGNKTSSSGNGILCYPLSKLQEGEEIHGIFLHMQMGLGVPSGSWGKQEMSFSELQNFLPSAYRELKRIMALLQKHYGDNCYIEYTIEGEEIYILDFKKRRRDVYKSCL